MADIDLRGDAPGQFVYLTTKLHSEIFDCAFESLSFRCRQCSGILDGPVEEPGICRLLGGQVEQGRIGRALGRIESGNFWSLSVMMPSLGEDGWRTLKVGRISNDDCTGRLQSLQRRRIPGRHGDKWKDIDRPLSTIV